MSTLSGRYHSSVRGLFLAPVLLLGLVTGTDLAAKTGQSGRWVDFGDCVVEFPDAPAKAVVPLGTRTIVVLIVDFADETVENTYNVGDPLDYVSGVMYDNPRNTAGAIAEASFGRTLLESDADGDGEHDIFKVTIPSTIVGSPCDQHGWADQADAAAESLGIDLGLYQNRMYVLPLVDGCGGWAGRAEFVGVRSWMRTIFETAYPHEIGHNFGLHHSSTDPDNDGEIDREYGDTSDVMGSAPEWRSYNAPHKAQMRWLPSSAIHDVFGGGTQVFTLEASVIDPAAAVYPQVVRISRPDVPERPYYLSYRVPMGYDEMLNEAYTHRLQIHNADITESVQTYFIAALDDGEAFEDANAHDLVITQLFHDATTVTIEIQRNEPDLDGDGFGQTVDCDDADGTVYPTAPEICDGADNDCNGAVDEAVELDPDRDAICDAADNCINVANASQVDGDADGVGDACDCDPADPANAEVIGPVTDLRFETADDLAWSLPRDVLGGQARFDVLRSTAPDDFGQPVCVVKDSVDLVGADPESPTAVHYYLVRTESACGDHLGLGADQQRRSGGACRSIPGIGDSGPAGSGAPPAGRTLR